MSQYLFVQLDRGLGIDGTGFDNNNFFWFVSIYRTIEIDAAAARICRDGLLFTALDPSISTVGVVLWINRLYKINRLIWSNFGQKWHQIG
jgi:hypothetical protein